MRQGLPGQAARSPQYANTIAKRPNTLFPEVAMPDLSSLAAGCTADTDPEICACVAKLDETIANITSYYDSVVSQLSTQLDRALQYGQATQQNTTSSIMQLVTNVLSSAVASYGTVTDSLYSQALHQLTELVIGLQGSGIPIQSLGTGTLPQGTPGGITNVPYLPDTIAQIVGGVSGSGTTGSQSSSGGTATYGTAGTPGGTGGTAIQNQPVGTNVPGGSPVPLNTVPCSPLSTLDRVIVVGPDGGYVGADVVRDPSNPGVVFVFPSSIPVNPGDLGTGPVPLSPGAGSPLPTGPVAPGITPGLAGAGIGYTGSSPAKGVQIQFNGQSSSNGTTGPLQAIPPSQSGQATGQQQQGSIDINSIVTAVVAAVAAAAAAANQQGGNFSQEPGSGGSVPPTFAPNLFGKNGNGTIVPQTTIDGETIDKSQSTAEANAAVSCPSVQVVFNLGSGTGPGGQGNNQSGGPNPVGIEQPFAFRFEQRNNPWFRDAFDWSSDAFKQLINATSEIDYRNVTDPIIQGAVVFGEGE